MKTHLHISRYNSPAIMLPPSNFTHPSKLRDKASSQSKAKPTNFNKKHWNSSDIELILPIAHTLSDKSIIHYPNLQTNRVQLPRLAVLEISRITNDVASLKPFVLHQPQPLPVIETPISAAHYDDDESNEELILLRQSGISNAVLRRFTFTDIISIESGDGQYFRVALPVFNQSTTLRHIQNCSSSFKEGTKGICLSSLPCDQLGFIFEYLNRVYLAKEKVDISAYPPFHISCDMLLDLMQNALYLDITTLVEYCAISIAKQFSKIESFDNIPDSLIRSILKHVNIGELVLAQNLLIPSDMNTNTLWLDNVWKVVERADIFKEWPSRFVSPTVSFPQQICIEFYISQVLHKISKDPNVNRFNFQRILAFEGNSVQELVIRLEHTSDRMDLNFWIMVLENCKSCETIYIHCHHVNRSLPALLAALTILYRSISITLNLYIHEDSITALFELAPFLQPPSLLLTTTPKKPLIPEQAGALRMKTENSFNIQGVSKVSEYLDRTPLAGVETEILQQTRPISVAFIKQGPKECNKRSNIPLSCVQTQYLFPQITQLTLADVCLGVSGVKAICSLVTNAGPSISITHLDLTNTSITGTGIILLLEAIEANKSALMKLVSLHLSKILDKGDSQISESAKAVAQILPLMSRLESFNFAYNQIPIVGARQIVEALAKSTCKSIDLSGLNIVACLPSLAQWSSKTLKFKLVLSKLSLASRSLSSFVTTLSSTYVDWLDLSENKIDSSFPLALKDWIAGSNLTYLNLSSCDYILSPVVLVDAKRLHTVILRGNRLDDNFAVQIARHWNQGQLLQIKKWDLCENSIGDEGILACKDSLSKLYRKLKRIITIDIRSNRCSAQFASNTQSKSSFEGLLVVF